ncbi:MAG: 2-(1,2-epoxy,2-dihydrophenyl)acetyl-CoA isomerase [Actinomycetota bacterium]|nr:2-(1,2-epoxy,2-dihydrophenyl)acetyl-CoA isomerase [Actinomycetota bacterium]
MSDTVLYDVAHGVATVTLNRPDAMNALNTELKESLRDTLRAAADDDAVRAVVLTGNGRAFCVGQDLGEHARNLAAATEGGDGVGAVWTTVPEHYTPIATTLATMPKPVIAAVNGVAAGAGAAFAFACDFRIVASTAGFNLAFAAVGLSADSGSSWTLPRLVGMARAKELLLRPSTVPADRALELGIASQVVDAAELLPTAQQLAAELAAGPTVAYGAIRRSLAYSAGHGIDESLAFEGEMMALTGATADHQRAVLAFLAKDKPAFEGR